ncbi:cell envelope integrity protein TolA [Candidatus Tokpelaia sp.]|uniref:cell envelope integrity protein TolA n=1 Tax=Candidatus Tokpelaia sp. TaxID=2233777 RepID=UPI00123AA416|nr:cell envelope integrity protein TolA [Candidatus Tokpelaia sp.]KAA6405437.1 hypothetical protein DPQ22_05125 [Candidatus Tokpelaia sp.]
MKAGFSISIIAHIVILAILLVSFYVPPPPNLQQMEEVPISLVPLGEEMSVKQGDKQAAQKTAASPKPTKKPEIKPAAENVGEADIDTKMPLKPREKPREVKAPPPPKGEAEDKPEPVTAKQPAEPAKPVEPQPEEAPEKPLPPKPAEAEPAATPPPAAEAPNDDIGDFLKSTAAEKVETEKQEQPKPEKEQPKPDTPALPQTAPKPAKKPETEPKKPQEKPAAAKGDKDGAETADSRNALIDRTRTQGGGAKRSQGDSGQGATKTIGNQDNLQQTLNNIIGTCVQRNWDIGVVQGSSAYDLRVKMHFRLNPDGSLAAEPDLTPAGGDLKDREVIAMQARTALKKCAPFNLPADAYAKWRDVTVNMRAFPD